MTVKKGILAILIFSPLVLVGIMYTYSYYRPLLIEKTFPTQPTMEDWGELFENNTTATAYKFFLQHGSKLKYSEVHPIAHLVGVILYEKEGVRGISYCTMDFGFGCFHGFAGILFQTEGVKAVESFNVACKKFTDNFSKCVHGAGHGILGHTGREELIKALKLCDTFKINSNTGGCLGGVFMEYNNNTTNHVGNIQIRPFERGEFEEPCLHGVPEEYRAACYYELPPWWLASDPDIYRADPAKKLATLCDNIDPSFHTVCYRGIGNISAINTDYTIHRMKSWCTVAPTQNLFDACYIEALTHLDTSTLKGLCRKKEIDYRYFCNIY